MKAAEMADTVKETAKDTLDGAWKAAKDTTRNIKEAVVEEGDECEGPNRGNTKDGAVEDLRQKLSFSYLYKSYLVFINAYV